MKIAGIFCFSLFFVLNAFSQGVVASGTEPAWLLDWDGDVTYTLYIGEESSTYTLMANPAPEGSSIEIAESWTLKGNRGKTAVLVVEYFDPESPESCPCFHDFGEGLNAGKAYLITENQKFYVGCAEYVENPLTHR
jgi:hypothetical protein|tara:strand:- start:79016 stop:79423 length:408 start_codon:yes stop_codon:yes gene_type:complete